MAGQRKKVFIISLDGATFDILRPLAQQGYMPNLARLIDQGLAAELESVIPPVTAPAWTSFMTGKNPSKHGIFDFTRFNAEDYSWSINNAQHIRSKTVWQILSEKGKRVFVLNLPYTYPPYEVNGILVSGWDAPSGEKAFTYPPSVAGEILEMFPDYKANLWVSELLPRKSDAQFSELTNRLTRGFEQGTKLALHYLDQQPWDVFMVHFQQTDWIQHKLWAWIEQACRDPKDHSTKVEAARNCYRLFDEGVGQLLRRMESSDALTIVLSDHGFGRMMGSIYPNYYLSQWGYLKLKSAAVDNNGGLKSRMRNSNSAVVRKFYRALSRAKKVLESSTAEKHESWADNAGDVLSARGQTIDWGQTKVATLWAYQLGFLYVNIAGRAPQGIVESGDEYERIVSDVIEKFRDIRDPRTGEKLLTDVLRGTDAYPTGAGERITLPDVVLIPRDGLGFSFTVSDAAPEVSEEGCHRHNGVVLFEGADVKKTVSGFYPNLIDIAPTILHTAGLPVPGDMDGRVLEEIFTKNQQVEYEEVNNSLVQEASDYSGEEAELIEQRLKGLGYLE